MDSNQWLRIEEFFQKALEVSGDERDAYIDSLRKTHPDDVPDVLALIRAHEQSGGFLETSIMQEVADLRGKVIGPWRILEEIGHGGMSTVCLAERIDGLFERRVAVKFLHGLIPGTDMKARLLAEQKILARLQHPNIAGLIDAGVTTEGRPYFILEYIDGMPVTDWCEQHVLPLDDRLDLFEQMCEAVHFAHQQLIVHRDLKPSNIMVSGDGIVKLLDFGIAKLLDDSTEATIPATRTGLFLMTPEYASPEQITGGNITTACDVYALGLLLCEMLTGKMPYDVNRKSPLEVGHVITLTEPVKPSSLLYNRNPVQRGSEHTAESTGTPSPQVAAQKDGKASLAHIRGMQSKLKGDLDNIILKALRKDPARRYGSADQLLSDIRRYRQNLPVSARPEKPGYLVRKFIRRHRTGVAIAALVALLLTGAATFSILQAVEAEKQRKVAEERYQDVRQLAGSFLFEFHDAIANLPGSTYARELVIERSLQYLDRLTRQEALDRDLWIELAAAYNQVGNVQGNPTNANLGRTTDAIESYNKGLQWVTRAIRQDSLDVQARTILASIHVNMGDVYAQTGALEAAEYYKRLAKSVYRELVDMEPDNRFYQTEYAISGIKLGDLLGNPNFQNLGRPAESLAGYKTALGILEDISRADTSDNSNLIRLLGLANERIGTMYEIEGDHVTALDAYLKSLRLREQYLERNAANTNAIRDVAIAHEKVAGLYRNRGNLDEALQSYHRSLEIFSNLAASDPRNAQARRSLAICHIHLGNLAYHESEPSFRDRSLARKHFQASIELLEVAVMEDPENIQNTRLIGIARNQLAGL
ncbi:MAG: serine/threonine protein kinase [Balneolaceae bacterium]|nr:MAG: serine/threonine protein kinase [Balneolaceae bacterium]